MKPLIEIQTVPISIEFKTSSARFERVESSATVELSRNTSGNYRIRSRPIKVDVDTFESRRMPMPHTPSSTSAASPAADVPAQTQTYNATAQFLPDGQMQLNVSFNSSDVSGAESSGVETSPSVADAPPVLNKYSYRQVQRARPQYVPNYPASTPTESPNLSIMYEMDKVYFDMQSKNVEFEFVPADIEFSVKEYPSVVIKYLGGPIYIPPSADPDYEPVDTQA